MESRDNSPELATCLVEESELIIQKWTDCVQNAVTAVNEEPVYIIRNHIKLFIQNLAVAIKNPDWKTVDLKNIQIGKEHGRQRSELKDYSLDHIIKEYHLLRKTLLMVKR